MWCNFLNIFTAGVEWNELNALQEDYCMAHEDNTTPNHPLNIAREDNTSPSHPSNIGEVSSAANPTVDWSLESVNCESKEKMVFFLRLRTYDVQPSPLLYPLQHSPRGWIEGS